MRIGKMLASMLAGLALSLGICTAPVLSQQANSADGGTVAVLSLANLDRLLNDVSYVLRASNVPEMGGLVSVMANQYTQGLDRARPAGAVVSMQGPMPVVLVFLPLADREAFFGALGGLGIEPDDLGGGMYEISANGNRLFVKEQNKWLYVSQSEEGLATVPAEPAGLLSDLPERYDLALKLNVQALPGQFRDMIVQQVRAGFERGMAEQRGQTADEQQAAREMGEASLAQIEELVQTTEQLLVGWGADSKAQNTFLETVGTFVEGSSLAAQADMAKDLKSAFTTFGFTGAAADFRITHAFTDKDRTVAKMNLSNSVAQLRRKIETGDEIPNQEVRQAVLKLVDGLQGIIEKTIEEGKLDGAASMSVADGALRVLVGGRIADGKALETELKNAIGLLGNGSAAPKAEFNYATHQGASLHRLMVPVKIADPAAKKVFGDTLHFTIATSEKVFAIALDQSGDASIKQAIDRIKAAPATAASATEGRVELGQILQFAQTVSPNSMTDLVLQTLQQYAGKDKVLITTQAIPRGAAYRFTVEEGVLRAAGAAAKAGQNNNGF